jgi:tetratricopeptide (TPR) repeat protein
MEALQRHTYSDAARAFQAIIMGFPAERGLVDRARVYLEICERESRRRPAAPKTIEERLTAATAALNNADDSHAEELARSVLGDDPKHDLALYLLAVIHARRGDRDGALDLLGKVIALSPEASAQARNDDDFAGLRHDEAFKKLTEPPIGDASRHRRLRGER